MPIPVACQCGQQFAANDQLAGHQVACPACGRAIAIPGRPAPPPPPSAPQQQAMQQQALARREMMRQQAGAQAVRCPRCGTQFAAGAHLAGQTLPCPRCQSPIQVAVPGTGPAPVADDMFDELPTLEEQEEVLSDDARREARKKKNQTQRLKEAEFRKKSVVATGQVSVIVAGFLLLGWGGWHAYEACMSIPQLKDVSFERAELPMTIARITLVAVLGLTVPLALLGSPMLLTANGMGRLFAFAAVGLMAVTLLAFLVVNGIQKQPPLEMAPLVAEFLMQGAILSLLFFPGVKQHLAVK